MKSLVLACALLSGCALAPDVIFTNADHISHPLNGAPLNNDPEYWLDTIGVTARWERGDLFYEAGLSYKTPDSPFKGDDCLFNGRIGYNLWRKQ